MFFQKLRQFVLGIGEMFANLKNIFCYKLTNETACFMIQLVKFCVITEIFFLSLLNFAVNLNSHLVTFMKLKIKMFFI